MAKNCFIYETLNDVKKLNIQKSDDGLMKLHGVFGQCGVRNNNSRIYETKNYAKMVERMQERIKKAPIPGELEHPNSMNINLENISHRIDSINIDENGVVSGEITLLDTPKGKIAQAIVKGGLPLFISSRATGQVDPKTGIVTLENLQTYDLVGSPGFSQAELHLNENQVAESINESCYYVTEKGDDEASSVDDSKDDVKDDASSVDDSKDDAKNENINDMELKDITEKMTALEERVASLEKANESLKEENESLREIAEDTADSQVDVKALADSIQKWIVEEYSPVLQNWIVEEFGDSLKDEISESINESHPNINLQALADGIQKWILEEYSPEVEKWSTTELAEGIQKWIVEEYSPEVEKWLNESYMETIQNKINECVDNKINEAKQTTKADNLSAIDETLKLLESIEVQKPAYQSKKMIKEGADNEPKFIAEMPDDVRVKWNMASDQVKESIERRAKLYNFSAEGAVQKFWEGIDFNAVKPSAPVSSIYEGLDNVVDERERVIRSQFRSWRSRR